MNWTQSTIEDVAYHEAGHAVVAHLLAWTIHEVMVGKSPTETSYCHVDPSPQIDRPNDWIRQWIRFYSAGMAANRRELRPEFPNERGYSLWSWRRDILTIDELATLIASNLGHAHKHAEQVAREEEDRVQSLIDDRWPAVTAVANELLRRRPEPLPGDEAHKIIADALAAS